MKVTINGITFEGSEEEVKNMIEWQEKRMSTPTCETSPSVVQSEEPSIKVTFGQDGSGATAENKSPSASASADGSAGWTDKKVEMPRQKTCPHGKGSCAGCEYLGGDGTCHAVCYPTYPPQYDKCVYS